MYFKFTKRGIHGVLVERCIRSHEDNPRYASNKFYSHAMNNEDIFSGEILIALIPGYKINDKTTFELARWCKENCNGEWLVGYFACAFADELDAMAFKLRWMES